MGALDYIRLVPCSALYLTGRPQTVPPLKKRRHGLTKALYDAGFIPVYSQGGPEDDA